MSDLSYRPPAVTTLMDVTVTDPKAVEVRDRLGGRPGAAINFGLGVALFLTPEVEAQLLALLMQRAPKLALHNPGAVLSATSRVRGDNIRPINDVAAALHGSDRPSPDAA